MKTILPILLLAFLWGLPQPESHAQSKAPSKAKASRPAKPVVPAKPSPADDALFEQANAAFERADYTTARVGWETLAEKGQARAMLKLGWAYISAPVAWGLDDAKGVQWYQRCIKAGEPQCMHNLGLELTSGRRLKQDLPRGLDYYRMAVKHGHAAAMGSLGWHYEHGDGVPKDLAMAMQWYRKGAEAGDALAMANLGNMYRLGIGVAVDLVQARNWLEKGAVHGNAYAKENLARLPAPSATQAPLSAATQSQAARLSPGASIAMDSKIVEGLKWRAVLPLRVTPSGPGAEEFAQAVKLLQRATVEAERLGHVSGDSLADDFRRKQERYRSISADALPLLDKAVALGSRQAMDVYRIAYCGWGVSGGSKPVDFDLGRCREMSETMAAEGHSGAMTDLGILLFKSENPKDWVQAESLLDAAARMGSLEAQMRLGELYNPRWKRLPNPELSRYWYTVAAQGGHEQALQKLNYYFPAPVQLSPAQQAFVDRVEREGPNRSDPASFAYDVGVYCQYGGKRCQDLRGQSNQFERSWNAQAQSANTQRIWNVYRREAEDPDKRSKCLQEYSEALRRQNAGQQQRVDVPKC